MTRPSGGLVASASNLSWGCARAVAVAAALGVPALRRIAINARGPPWLDTTLADALVLLLEADEARKVPTAPALPALPLASPSRAVCTPPATKRRARLARDVEAFLSVCDPCKLDARLELRPASGSGGLNRSSWRVGRRSLAGAARRTTCCFASSPFTLLV